MSYTKQTWDTTSYVNPTRMNHIEDGIKANSDVLDAIKTETVSATITANANSWGSSAISPTIPTGYHIKSISAYSTHLALAGTSVAFSGGTYQIYAYNIATGERTGAVYATFVYEKD